MNSLLMSTKRYLTLAAVLVTVLANALPFKAVAQAPMTDPIPLTRMSTGVIDTTIKFDDQKGFKGKYHIKSHDLLVDSLGIDRDLTYYSSAADSNMNKVCLFGPVGDSRTLQFNEDSYDGRTMVLTATDKKSYVHQVVLTDSQPLTHVDLNDGTTDSVTYANCMVHLSTTSDTGGVHPHQTVTASFGYSFSPPANAVDTLWGPFHQLFATGEQNPDELITMATVPGYKVQRMGLSDTNLGPSMVVTLSTNVQLGDHSRDDFIWVHDAQTGNFVLPSKIVIDMNRYLNTYFQTNDGVDGDTLYRLVEKSGSGGFAIYPYSPPKFNQIKQMILDGQQTYQGYPKIIPTYKIWDDSCNIAYKIEYRFDNASNKYLLDFGDQSARFVVYRTLPGERLDSVLQLTNQAKGSDDLTYRAVSRDTVTISTSLRNEFDWGMLPYMKRTPLSPPNAVQLLLPSNGSKMTGTQHIQLVWTYSGSSVSSYRLHITSSQFTLDTTLADTSLLLAVDTGTYMWSVAAENKAGEGPTSSAFVFSVAPPAGVQITEQMLSCIYPNPTSGEVTVHLGAAASRLELRDLLGRVVRTFDSGHAQEFTFNISDLPAGAYALRDLASGKYWMIVKE